MAADAAIEMYLSRLEEEILSLDGKISYSNLTKGERNALYLLRDDSSIIIKEADSSLTFLPYTSISSFILALLICLGVGTNWSPFERTETSSLDRLRLHKLITLALTNFPSYLLLRIVALLSWTSFSKGQLLELSLSLLEGDKLGLSLLNISEFTEILEALLISTEEGANVNKLTKFKISGEKSSQKFFRSAKKVNKLECFKNLSSTSCLDVSSV